jgi:serine/threonine protein kinase
MAKLAKYELLAKIATGGMAEIHVARARDAGENRICVVKKLLPQHASNDEFRQMFLDEGRIAARFDHPNVVRVHDFGSEDGAHYIAMDYLHGEDLRTVLRTLRGHGATMPIPMALAVISAVCAGLHHAHEMHGASGEPLEIVHRDVSPHNVFVTFDGSVKIVDFGIAKSVDRDWETKHGTLKGKVPYMSPEQIKGRRLDRRADVYAVGVMLYELVLGRRPYVLATSGDFAMMMAITRHDIRAPSAVDPKVAGQLENIILGAIAYDPKARYQTAKALQDDLDAFARKRSMDTSPRAVAAFLGGLFEARYEEWRRAQRAEHDLAAHVVRVEEERAHSEVHEDYIGEATDIDEIDASSASAKPPSVAPPGSAASIASASAAVASVIELFGVTVVTLQGRIDESFDGSALGASLTGPVLFDMGGVERITSFGVREWLEMMAALAATEDVDPYLARCSEAVVTQLSLIRTFAGRAKVISFDVPFLCNDCGNTFVRALDCAADSPVIVGERPAMTRCARCGGEAHLDDDPAYLAFAVPFVSQTVPDRVRGVLQRLLERASSEPDAVDKVITANETRVRVHRELDPGFRWNRVLDGIEGTVVVDFRGTPRFGRDAAERFAQAMRALGPEVTSCEVVECPIAVAIALRGKVSSQRVRSSSLALEGRCASCNAARTGTIAAGSLEEAYRAGATAFVPCRRCNGPLQLDQLAPAMEALFGTPSSPALAVAAPFAASAASPRADVEDAERSAPSTSTPHVVPPAPHGGDRRGWFVLGGVALAAIVTAGLLRARGSDGAPPALTPAASASSALTTSLPDVADAGDAIDRRADGVFATVTARARDEDQALANARSEALALMLGLLEHDLDPAVRAANEASDARASRDEAAAHFAEQVGAFASPDRLSVRRGAGTGAVVLTVSYRIGAAAWTRVTAFYSETRSLGGVRLAPTFPTRGRGLVVVGADAAMSAEVPVGARLERLDGREATSLDALASARRGRHVATVSRRGERVEAKINVQ